MKHKYKLLSVILLSMVTVIACDNSEESSDDSSLPTNGELLETPVLSFQETVYIDQKPYGNIFWDEQSAANHFEYQISNQDIQLTNTTSILLPYGHSLIVRAVNQISAIKTDWSKPYVYFANPDYQLNNIQIADENMVAVHFFDADIDLIIVTRGQTILKPNNPVKANNTFNGWYADPYRTAIFDFSKPILQPTIIYASWIRSQLIDNVSFWLKVDSKISSQVQSQPVNVGDWTFVPLRLNEEVTHINEFKARISVNGATSDIPARLLVMNGFDDLSGRAYWKDGSANFLINSDGIYDVYFSAQRQWTSPNSNIVHVNIVLVTGENNNSSDENLINEQATTLLVYIDNNANIAYWDEIDGAISYQYVINNEQILSTDQTEIALNPLSHIIVRAIFSEDFSPWSIPVINRSVSVTPITGDQLVSVYFYGLEQDSYYVIKGNLVSEPSPPSRLDYDFEGWFIDIANKTPFDFSQPIMKNTVIYSKWTKAIDIAIVYFTNTLDWNNIYIYMWKDGVGNSYKKVWPGDLMVYLRTNSHDDDMYYYQIDLSLYDCIIFTASISGPQTVNISLSGFHSNMGYYPTTMTGSKYNVGTYTYNPS